MPHENGRIYGSFKKICIPEAELKIEAKAILPNLISLKSDWESGQISDSHLSFQLVLLYLESRVKKHPFLRMGKPLPNRIQSQEFLEVVRFYGMPDTVRFALWKWHLGEWDIRLINYNPSSLEMLESQSHGYRYSTISWEHALEGSLVEEKRDAFEHLLHDLAHAYMFFREDYDYEGQKQFFKDMWIDYPKYEPVLNTNPIFRSKFEYCISDMNSHPAHLASYWNAIRREAGIPIDANLKV